MVTNLRTHYPILLFLGAVLLLGDCDRGASLRDPDHERERRLKPAIAFVEKTIETKGRLPNRNEFTRWEESQSGWIYTLWDRTDEYAARKGATNANDYMVGVWRADWFHYYRSWDGRYLDASDEYPWP